MDSSVHRLRPVGGDAARREASASPLNDASGFEADAEGDGVRFESPTGTPSEDGYAALDLLVEGEESVKFHLRFSSADGETRVLGFRLLPACQARVRVPLAAIADDSFVLERDGAVLQRRVQGDRFDPSKLDQIELRLDRAASTPVRWWQTPLGIRGDEPPRLTDPDLPDGPLLDEFGQSARRSWSGKTESRSELEGRLRRQRDRPADRSRRAERSEWGGWTDGPRFEATGYFRIERDGDRWWLVDPDGRPFWSTGICCIRPYPETAYGGLDDALAWLPDSNREFAAAFDSTDAPDEVSTVNYLVANLIRAFGPNEWRDAWERIVDGELRRLGVTTVGAWSDREWARDAAWPYVRTLPWEFDGVESVAWDFPDVFSPAFEAAAEEVAAPLAETAGDAALVGYFLGNEPDWAWMDELPAWEMLRSTEACETRTAFAEWLRERYDSASALSDSWDADCSFADVESGRWTQSRPDGATADLRAFSERMSERFYETLVTACRRVDSEHLCLGTRFPWSPPEWAVPGLKSFDVLCLNCFRPRVPEEYGELCERLSAPLLVGEFLFGALDVGLPAPGVQWVPDQRARGDAYRVFVEDAASRPWCVGAHWYGLYDQSAMGKRNGANFNIGIYDVCNRSYEELLDSIRASNRHIYEVAAGCRVPYADEPEYLGVYF
ncbi:hypothetical protein NGM10_03955 [Halorussus salilacus]|uniref:hypothetical protein n=1 Tax=Halorussus salilacus TaxID=2953750 RepID=UPI00209CE8E1|nr:hypothetical protein [Halorussus salilacus]USZ68895.1 hypothetical protein NGM10_03955 [Halorussus salilacus]